MLNKTERIENRRILILENANAQNNYIDCDVIAYNITKLLEAKTNADIISFSNDLINAIGYRGGKTETIKELLREIKDIIPITLSGVQDDKQARVDETIKNCGVFFAFSKKQFDKYKTPLTPDDKYADIGAGGFIPKSKIDEYLAGMQNAIDTFERDINDNNLRESYIRYELNNHEAFYTGSIESTMEALCGTYTSEEVLAVYNNNK